MTEETIALKARHIINTQILQRVDKLLANLKTDNSGLKCWLGKSELEYWLITPWLLSKLENIGEDVFVIYDAYIWVREKTNLKDDTALKEIAASILQDMAVLGEK